MGDFGHHLVMARLRLSLTVFVIFCDKRYISALSLLSLDVGCASYNLTDQTAAAFRRQAKAVVPVEEPRVRPFSAIFVFRPKLFFAGFPAPNSITNNDRERKRVSGSVE